MRKLSVLLFLGSMLFSTFLSAGAYYAEPLTALTNPMGVHLKWSTYKELDVEHFVVEKSQDGQTFYEIGEQGASGFSLIDNKYHFLDMDNEPGTHFYRLRELASNGTVSYSFITSANVDHNRGMRVLKLQMDEGNGETVVTYDVRKAGSVTGYVIDINGRKVLDIKEDIHLGINTYTQSLEDFKPGFYILHLLYEGDHERFTLWKNSDEAQKLEPVASTNKRK